MPDSVAPPRLVYGGLDLTSAMGSDHGSSPKVLTIAPRNLNRMTG